MKQFFFSAWAVVLLGSAAQAHDTWVQTNTNVVRTGDAVHIDLMLGNHGNDHRDFKLAGKVKIEDAALQIVAPGGQAFDWKDRLFDTGYTPAEGYLTAPFVTGKAGLYTVLSTSDKVVDYAPKRSVKSAKTFFIASNSLDKVPKNTAGFNRVFGHALELVPETNPVAPLGPGSEITVRLYYKGKPLPNAKVSFIPRGAVLKEAKAGLDGEYERTTNANGRARFAPKAANYYLVVAHVEDKNAKGALGGKSYDEVKYSATLTVFVPQICPCCG